MENLLRNLGRHLTMPASAPKGKRGPWTLLLVEHQGKVISLGHIRRVMVVIALIGMVVLSSILLLYVLYHNAAYKADAPGKALTMLEQRITLLRKEKDILLARLVIAEEKIEVLQTRNQKKSPGSVNKTEKQTTPSSVSGAEDNAENQTKQHPVGVEEFQILYSPDKPDLEVKFHLVNLKKEAGPVSGFIFVVIKKQGGDDEDHIVLPNVPFFSGRPEKIDRGRYFTISRFNIIRLKTAFKFRPEQYPYARVLIFSKNGEVLFEKDFPFTGVNSPLIQSNGD